MIHLTVVDIDVNVFNKKKQRVMEVDLAHKEFTVRTVRWDGLLEERSCKMTDFLKFMGYEVTIFKNPKENEDGVV